ncbi:MAG: hypothetical protein HXY34_05315 [Candidatus Thorarchaeota archaeon]|nr:hypothetical protein [Candidatus Thorarchaeota archaeon]
MASDDNGSERFDETPEDGHESTTVKKKRLSRHARNRLKAYAAGGALLAWIVFLVLWLLIYASGFEFAQNAAVVVASFFLDVGLVAVVYSGQEFGRTRWRIKATVGLTTLLIVFLIMWPAFISQYFGYYQGWAVVAAVILSFLTVIPIIWMTAGPVVFLPGRVQAVAAMFVLWSILVVVWLWFFADGHTGYHNVAIMMGFILVLLLVNIGSVKVTVGDEKIQGTRPLGLLFLWFVVIIAWFWFFAEGLTGYQNAALVLVSFVLLVLLAYLSERPRYQRW